MDIYQVLALIGTLLSAEFILGVWIQNQFSKARIDSERHNKEILTKLEYHERHDDQRFGQLQDAMWNLRFSIRDRQESNTKND